jgi:hypothetical protein
VFRAEACWQLVSAHDQRHWHRYEIVYEALTLAQKVESSDANDLQDSVRRQKVNRADRWMRINTALILKFT